MEKELTCKEYLQVQTEGKRKVRRSVKTYDLDVIISVGYRVKTICHQLTEFKNYQKKQKMMNNIDEKQTLFEQV